MKRLAHLEECNRLGNAALEKSEKDNARLERSLREAHAAAQHAAAQHEEGEWQGDAPEVDEAAAAPEEEPISGQTWAPTTPMSYLMTPQKPPGFSHQSRRWTADADWTADAEPAIFDTPSRHL